MAMRTSSMRARAASSLTSAARHTVEITIERRWPTFSNAAPCSGKASSSRRVRISCGWRRVWLGPTMNSDRGSVRSRMRPCSRRASVTWVFIVSRAGCESPAGEALIRLPPTVACSRICWSANQTAHRPSSGACCCSSGSCWNAAIGVAAPRRMRPCARLTPCSSAIRLTSTSAPRCTSPARPSRAQGSRSVAPATMRAPATPSSASNACASVTGVR